MPRPKVITLNPTALDRNGITVAVSPGAAATLDIDGALATVAYDRNGVLAGAQWTAGTLSLATLGAAGRSFSAATRIVIWGASDESDKNFTIYGLDASGNAIIQETIAGPNNANVYTTNLFTSIEKITLDTTTTGSDVEVGVAGAAVFTQPQHITVYATVSDDVITITGTDRTGAAITENISGADTTTVVGTKNFATVNKVEIDGAATGVEVGVDGTCESNWFVLDSRNPNFNVGLGVDISSGATLTYDVEHTFNDVLASTFVEGDGTVFNHDTLNGQTANADGNYTNPPIAIRLALTAHTSGSANLRVIQVGSS